MVGGHWQKARGNVPKVSIHDYIVVGSSRAHVQLRGGFISEYDLEESLRSSLEGGRSIAII